MYKLVISPQAKKEIKKLPKKYQAAILTALKEIKEDPFLGKPLSRELTSMLSFRVGLYRIVYKINKNNKTIFVYTAGHRATVYK